MTTNRRLEIPRDRQRRVSFIPRIDGTAILVSIEEHEQAIFSIFDPSGEVILEDEPCEVSGVDFSTLVAEISEISETEVGDPPVTVSPLGVNYRLEFTYVPIADERDPAPDPVVPNP